MLTFREGVSYNDLLCLRLLSDEGLFFRRIADQQKLFPESASVLIMVALPFIALIESDALCFLRSTYASDIPTADNELRMIRNRTKSLKARGVDYDAYSRKVKKTLDEAESRFRYRNFVFSAILPRPKDVGVFYHDGMPVLSTYTLLNYLEKDEGLLRGAESEAYYRNLGQNAGEGGAILMCLSEIVAGYQCCPTLSEFKTIANDYSYRSMFEFCMARVTDDVASFFFLSEQLMLLSSVSALRRAGFLEDMAWRKLASVCLFHVFRATGDFQGTVRKGGNKRRYSPDFVEECSKIFEREDSRILKKVKKTRNAFIHYDFRDLLLGCPMAEMGPECLLEYAVQKSTGLNLREYDCFIERVTAKTIERLAHITGFPACNPRKNVL